LTGTAGARIIEHHGAERGLAVTGRLPSLGLGLGLALLLGCAPAPPSAAQSACPPTRPDSTGPFYRPGAPERASTGQGLAVSGTVRSSADCRPLAAARLEWWSANPDGRYDDAHRATQQADAEGRYRYETDFPAGYGFRRPHLHVRITAPGHRTLVTQLYPRPERRALEFDFVLVPE
jgi:protocatechuate 3,4-dioxygenase beta subunit